MKIPKNEKCKTINSATKILSTYKQGRRKQCEAAGAVISNGHFIFLSGNDC
jgi:hypothetical protein